MQAYRLLTEEDTSAFCHKVTAALAAGWRLYGDPAYAYDAASGEDALRPGRGEGRGRRLQPRHETWRALDEDEPRAVL